MTETLAAGWYPDPAGTPRLRYFDGHSWTGHYAALTPAAWAPPQVASAPVNPLPRSWWKRKRVLIPAAVMGILAINAANATNTTKSDRVAAAPTTTIATQVLATEVTSSVAATPPTTAAVPTTTAPAPTSTAAPTSALTTPVTTTPATAPPQVLPIAAPAEPELPVAEPETAPTTARATATTARQTASAYYQNCAEARAAGAAPMRRGDPGYREGLDKDKDGVACE